MLAPLGRLTELDVACTRDTRPKYQIAAASGMTPNVLSAIISGRQPATSEQIMRLARTLGVSPESIAPDCSELDGAA